MNLRTKENTSEICKSQQRDYNSKKFIKEKIGP